MSTPWKLDIEKIAIVKEYNTAYTLKDDVLFFKQLHELHLADWEEVDVEMMGDQFDYKSIIKSLKGEE
tara:strand:- start:1201 stop:1404 length:204 start_codon:yes stop_codon:yes gene_type:complete